MSNSPIAIRPALLPHRPVGLAPAVAVSYAFGHHRVPQRNTDLWNAGANRAFATGCPSLSVAHAEHGLAAIKSEIDHCNTIGSSPSIVAALTRAAHNVALWIDAAVAT